MLKSNVMLEMRAMEELAFAVRQLDGLWENGKHQCVTREPVTRDSPTTNVKERAMVIWLEMERFVIIRKDTQNALHQVWRF